jgi:hypothetical protein
VGLPPTSETKEDVNVERKKPLGGVKAVGRGSEGDEEVGRVLVAAEVGNDVEARRERTWEEEIVLEEGVTL